MVPVLLSAPVWGPRLLRQVPWFGVTRVEISGARLLTPHEVLAASGIRTGENIWDDISVWETALRNHPVIENAEISRKPFRTLRIRIEEERPVALVEAGTLRPATAAGELLPVNPARVTAGLPLIRTKGASAAGGRIGDAETRALLAETGRLRRLNPELVARVSEVRRNGAGELLLTLTDPAIELLLPPGTEPARLRQLRAVLADVERRTRSRSPNAAAPHSARIDLRFEDQIVVRYSLDRSPDRSVD